MEPRLHSLTTTCRASVSPEIALCLFRIVQEGLRNVQKHSGAAHAEVKLEMMDDELHLSISDDGKGFDM